MGGEGAFVRYWTWWGKLMLQDPHETMRVTSPVTILSAAGFGLASWCIWKSVAYDPEVRLRPHKKAWHITQQRENNAMKYRHGGFAWFYKIACPNRYRYVLKKYDEGFEDIPIPKE